MVVLTTYSLLAFIYPFRMMLLIIQSYPQNPLEFFINFLAVRESTFRTDTQAVHPSLHEYVKSLFSTFFNVSLENPSSLLQRRNRRSSPDHLLFQLPRLGIVSSKIIIFYSFLCGFFNHISQSLLTHAVFPNGQLLIFSSVS